MSARWKHLVTILVIGALLIGGNYVYRMNDSRLADLSKASHGWSAVSGLVVHSELKVQRSELRNNRTEHQVRVTYEYVVGDRSYRNDVVRFDQASMPVSEKEALVSSHPIGATVTVFYDPDNPRQSVLVQGSY